MLEDNWREHRRFYCCTFALLSAALLPIIAPMIDAIIDSTHPPHMGIHIKVFQKFGSTIDEIISKALKISGMYQILFGFRLTIKKQPEQSIYRLKYSI